MGSAAEAEEGDDHHEAPGAEDEDVHDLKPDPFFAAEEQDQGHERQEHEREQAQESRNEEAE